MKESECPIGHPQRPNTHPTVKCQMIELYGSPQDDALKETNFNEDTVDEGLDLPDSPENGPNSGRVDLNFPGSHIVCDGEHPREGDQIHCESIEEHIPLLNHFVLVSLFS